MAEDRNLIKRAFLRAAAVDYIRHFLGTPYLWGGDDPMAGFDCSGLVIEALQAVGLLRHGGDATAHDLWSRFRAFERTAGGTAGCLVFWFTDGRASHVELMVDDFHAIGASGGGSRTLSREDAIRQNAYVKMRPVGYRGADYRIVDPFMEAA